MAALGVFILWVGWYGFNPGSQLAFAGAVNADAVMLIATNTTLAAAAGTLFAMLYGWGQNGETQLELYPERRARRAGGHHRQL